MPGFIDSVFSKWTDNSKWTDVSKWTDNSLAVPSSPCNLSVAESTATKASHYVQSLGPTSYITKSTEVTILPRTAENDLAGMVSHVTITAEPVKQEPPTPPRSPAIQ